MIKRTVKLLFTFLALSCVNISALGKEFYEGPFFWEKKEIQKKMHTERYVPTSVTSSDEDGGEVWSMKGAGIIQAPCDFSYRRAQQFDELKKLKDHFPEVNWDQKKSELSLSFKILGRIQKMKFALKTVEEVTESQEVRRIQYEVIEGVYKSSKGALVLTNAGQHKCQAGLISTYKGKLFSFGSSVMAIAVEGVLRHIAQALRRGVEDAWIQSRN